ncbi:hypothetical protein KM043_011257 [Ampulex compressa]|nr:hypothetical protein KM043_011257 [Ampulex compressa]
MGIGKSAYEKNGRPNYIKLSEAEYKMIKNIWVDIENDPQFHGYSFFISFCDVYPQYIKFYTLDAHLSLTYDTRTTAKFTIIMETLGYLILDFYNKPKQQDRLIGYIAMVHKDMRLDKRDIFTESSRKWNTFKIMSRRKLIAKDHYTDCAVVQPICLFW